MLRCKDCTALHCPLTAKGGKRLKYETAYFCGYAKLPSALATTVSNGMLTLGLKVHLETGKIEEVSVTLLSPLAKSMVESYFIGRNVVDDWDEIVEEITYRHQGIASKPIIKAFGDVRRSYTEYMAKNGDYLRSAQTNQGTVK